MVAACQTAGHDGGHRPGDHGPVVVREALVVADGAAVAADPGEGALHHPAARQHLEGVGQAPADDVDPKAQGGSRPDHQLARVAGVGQTSRMRRCATRSRHSSGWAPSRSWMLAAVTTIASSNPRVSTAMWRLRPLTFLPASKPRLALATVSAARTDWESMIAALGCGWRPASTRTWSRRVSWTWSRVGSRLAAPATHSRCGPGSGWRRPLPGGGGLLAGRRRRGCRPVAAAAPPAASTRGRWCRRGSVACAGWAGGMWGWR